METSSPQLSVECRKFKSFDCLPSKLPWVHHGRTVIGMDCVGLIFWIYQNSGFPLCHLDLPYTPEDADDPDFFCRIIDRLENDFEEVTHAVISGVGCDGDILVLRDRDGKPHVGLLCGTLIYEMRARLIKTRMEFARSRIFKAFRLRELR